MAQSGLYYLSVLLVVLVGFVEAQRPGKWAVEQGLDDGSRKLMLTPSMLSGVMFLLIFVTILAAGLTCLTGVQTPSTFGDEKNPIKPLNINKQY